jgi:hypothetical protein
MCFHIFGHHKCCPMVSSVLFTPGWQRNVWYHVITAFCKQFGTTILFLWHINAVIFPPPWKICSSYFEMSFSRIFIIDLLDSCILSRYLKLSGWKCSALVIFSRKHYNKPKNDSCVSFRCVSILSSLLKASATTLWVPFTIYCSSGEYSSIYNLHLMTLSELKLLQVKFSWSMCTLIFCPKKYFWISSAFLQ